MFSQRAPKCLFDIRILNKTCVFFSFCFFALLDLVRVHAQAGPWGRPHAAYPIRPFERTFFTLQKKHFWAKVHWRSVHARVRKRFRKKCQKTRSGVSSGQRTPRQDKKKKKCVTCKSKKPGDSTHRKLHHERDPERPAPTRQPKKRLVKKTCFFSKFPGLQPDRKQWIMKIIWRDLVFLFKKLHFWCNTFEKKHILFS